MKVLSIDMDYFLNDITVYLDNPNRRQDSNNYKVWDEEEVIKFMKERFNLDRGEKIAGKIITHHNEAFYYWRELILDNKLKKPFDLIHVDAHLDMSYLPDATWMYIITKYIGLTDAEKMYPEKLNDYGESAHFGCGNFMLFAIANGWINNIDYLYHPKLIDFDFLNGFTVLVDKDNEVFKMGLDQVSYRDLFPKNIFELVSEVKYEVNISCCHKNKKKEFNDIDYILICQSPNYTPVESDKLMSILKEYVAI